MLFNSLSFAIFFPLVVILYYGLKPKHRWILLLISSYVFYMYWKPAFALLILFSTIVDYFTGLKMGAEETKEGRRKWLVLSLFSNLGLLFTFKYLDFFIESLNLFSSFVGTSAGFSTFDILLPVGISFYTFQTLSYTIEVYRGNQKPERHFGIFAVYVSFFPQLVAGPIERSTNLLPQFHKTNKFSNSNAISGLRIMLWGFFKKIVIADNLAIIVDQVYNNVGDYSGGAFIIATIFFAFQIYADFSGYSDIAIGAARIMGYNLMINFRQPYFSKSIGEFWKRWHISLSTWFRDYLYISLGGNRVVKWRWYYNLFITFLISGLWHGANWTFVIWGGLNGLYLILEIVLAPIGSFFTRILQLSKLENLMNSIKVITTFILICVSWVFFRANDVQEAFYIFQTIYTSGFKDITQVIWPLLNQWNAQPIVGLIDSLKVSPLQFNIVLVSILLMEIFNYYDARGDAWEHLRSKPQWFRWGIYYGIVTYILLFGNYDSNQFIYFQF